KPSPDLPLQGTRILVLGSGSGLPLPAGERAGVRGRASPFTRVDRDPLARSSPSARIDLSPTGRGKSRVGPGTQAINANPHNEETVHPCGRDGSDRGHLPG